MANLQSPPAVSTVKANPTDPICIKVHSIPAVPMTCKWSGKAALTHTHAVGPISWQGLVPSKSTAAWQTAQQRGKLPNWTMQESYPVGPNKISTNKGHVREGAWGPRDLKPSVRVRWYPWNNPPALPKAPLVPCRGECCTVAAMPSRAFKPNHRY